MKYLNPFTVWNNKHRSSNWPTTRTDKAIFEYRGVSVFKSSFRCWDYVKDQVCITQLAGFNKERAKEIIDNFTDSTTKNESTTYHAYERTQAAHKDGLEMIKGGALA